MADFSGTPHLQSGLAGSHILGALLAILLLSFLALDVLTLYSLRVRLQHSLLQAARQASVHQARPETIAQTFSQGLAAAKVPRHDQWQIQIVSPSSQAFAWHGRPSPQHEGRPAITQGWQALQAEQAGHNSPSIYQANTLHLYLVYAHQAGPLSLMRLLPQLPASVANPLNSAAVWLHLEIKHPMQSDAVQWDDLPDGWVIYARQTEDQAALAVSQADWPAPLDSPGLPSLSGNEPLSPWDGQTQEPQDGLVPPTPKDTGSGEGNGAPDSHTPNPACY